MYKNICIICTKECTLFDLRRGIKNIIKNGQKFNVNYHGRFELDSRFSSTLFGQFYPEFNHPDRSHRTFLIDKGTFTKCFKIIKLKRDHN